jgi:hypothetical protein
MKPSREKKNMELLTKMWELVREIDGMPTGEMENAINDGMDKMKVQLQWSLVYHMTDEGTYDEVLFEGPASECTDYVIDHPELKGHCIITANY